MKVALKVASLAAKKVDMMVGRMVAQKVDVTVDSWDILTVELWVD